MAEPTDPNRDVPPTPPPAGEPRNRSVESTKWDQARAKELHENAEGLGAAAGAGLGCLGIMTLPWSILIFVFLAAVVVGVLAKGCGAGH